MEIVIFPSFIEEITKSHKLASENAINECPFNWITVSFATSAATPSDPKNAGIRGESLNIYKASLAIPKAIDKTKMKIIESLFFLITIYIKTWIKNKIKAFINI